MKLIKSITAYAVVASHIDDFYVGGNEWALAIFHKKKDAVSFSKGCTSGYGEPQPHVIKVNIEQINPTRYIIKG